MGQGQAERWIRRTTTVSVLLVAVIAAVVSYRHIHQLVLEHGEDAWAAALIPLSVDGTIIAASMSLLLTSRYGGRGGVLPWIFLTAGGLASLGANVAVAEPTLIGRIIAAWPPFALIGAYEMLMSQIRRSARRHDNIHGRASAHPEQVDETDAPGSVELTDDTDGAGPVGRDVDTHRLRQQAWQWALQHRRPDGELPTGVAIARAFNRSPRWGRDVKGAGVAGELTDTAQRKT